MPKMERTPKVREIDGRFEPWFEIDGRTIYLGRYRTKIEANQAYHRRWRRERINFIRKIVAQRSLGESNAG